MEVEEQAAEEGGAHGDLRLQQERDQEHRGQRVRHHVDDVVGEQVLSEGAPLEADRQQVNRRVVERAQRGGTARREDLDDVLARELSGVGVVGDVLDVVRDQLV